MLWETPDKASAFSTDGIGLSFRIREDSSWIASAQNHRALSPVMPRQDVARMSFSCSSCFGDMGINCACEKNHENSFWLCQSRLHGQECGQQHDKQASKGAMGQASGGATNGQNGGSGG